MTVNEYNYAQLRQAKAVLDETVRHNVASEQVERGKLYETQRHQLASEGIDRAKVDETIRHDNTMEAIQKQSNYITDWYNRNNIAQNAEKLQQTGLTSTATANKTNKEASVIDRTTDAQTYSLYTNANAATVKSEAYKQNAATNAFNAKVNAVINTGKWVTGTLTDLGGLFLKAGNSNFSTKTNSSNTGSKYKQEQEELNKYLEDKGYWK